MTALTTRLQPPDADDIPVDRLPRPPPEQFRLAAEAGAFPEADRVELVDGLLRRGGPAGPLCRLTLDRYHRMEEAGALTRNDRVELLEGWLIAQMANNPPHRWATRRVRVAVERLLPPGWLADEQKPISLPLTGSEPEPDIQMARGVPDDYAGRHPGPSDLGLLIEVSDSTVAQDRRLKARIYALEGIPIYWIVNLVARRLEVYTDPSDPSGTPGYRLRKDYGPGEEVPLILDGREVGRIAVDDLLP